MRYPIYLLDDLIDVMGVNRIEVVYVESDDGTTFHHELHLYRRNALEYVLQNTEYAVDALEINLDGEEVSAVVASEEFCDSSRDSILSYLNPPNRCYINLELKDGS